MDPIRTFALLKLAEERRDRQDESRRATIEMRLTSLLEQQHFEAALEVLKELPEEEITDSLLILAGSTWSATGSYEKALVYFDRHLAGKPQLGSRIRCLTEKGQTLRHMGRVDEAIELLETLRAETAEVREAQELVRTDLASIFLDLGRTAEAAEHLEWAAQSNPRAAYTHQLYATALARLGSLDDAIRMAESATALDPRSGQYQLVRADILIALGKNHEAKDAIEKAHGLGYMSPRWFTLALALAMLLQSKYDVAQLLKIIRRDIKGQRRERVLDEAISIWQETIGHRPKNAYVRFHSKPGEVLSTESSADDEQDEASRLFLFTLLSGQDADVVGKLRIALQARSTGQNGTDGSD